MNSKLNTFLFDMMALQSSVTSRIIHMTEAEWADLKVLPKIASNGHHSIGEGCTLAEYNEALIHQNAISYPVKPIYRNWIRNGVTV